MASPWFDLDSFLNQIPGQKIASADGPIPLMPNAAPSPAIQSIPKPRAVAPQVNSEPDVELWEPKPVNAEQDFERQFMEGLNQRKADAGVLAQQAQMMRETQPSMASSIDMKPMMAYLDSLNGTRAAQGYTSPETLGDRQTRVQALEAAARKAKGEISNDQLGYLKMKADAQAVKERNAMMRELGYAREDRLNQPKDPRPERLTDGMQAAALFGHRMQDADTQLEGLYSNNKAYFTSPNAAGERKLPEGFKSDLLKQASQAETNFITAVLRRESGASISPAEFATAEKQYFARWGDSPELLEQKRQNRLRAIEGMRIQSGSIWDKYGQLAPPAIPKPQASAPAPGDAKMARLQELRAKAGL